MINIHKIIKYVKNPSKMIVDICHYGNYQYAPFVSDKLYLKCLYQVKMGEKLNLKKPTGYSEKMQWLKIHNRNPELSRLVDKYEAKEYLKEVIGEKYIIGTYGVYDSFDEIDFSSLPDSFVMKCTHDSGSVVVCEDKKNLDIEFARVKLTESLNRNYYWRGREWWYKNVKPRIIVEEYLFNKDKSPLIDYKFYCLGGKPRYFMYSIGEASHDVRNLKFDMNKQCIDQYFKSRPALDSDKIELPDNFDEMVSIVEKLSVGFQFIRVDLYNIDGRICVGELTLGSGSGMMHLVSKEYSDMLAGFIDIEAIKKEEKKWN